MMASKDIRPILAGWPYESGRITVRKIVGLDKTPKIQMRLDLGVRQMNETGRPDGKRPHGAESLLHYHLDALAQHQVRNGTPLGFELSSDECREFRDEALLYYFRYLAFFVLEEYEDVVRDTARNLEVLDLCREFGAEPYDRFILEQYRPYILMMNARAKAHNALDAGAHRAALAHLDAGLSAIRSFFASIGHEEVVDDSHEVNILDDLRRHIEERMPVRPVDRLRRKLDRAVEQERYEEAAQLRDEISKLESRSG